MGFNIKVETAHDETCLKAVLDEVKNYASDYVQWIDVEGKIKKKAMFFF